MAERSNGRKVVAVGRALAALTSLERNGLRAWLVGSLAKDRFGVHSDVDVLVECRPETESRAFKIVENEMQGFPFHVIPTCDLDAETLSSFLKEAVDASGVRART